MADQRRVSLGELPHPWLRWTLLIVMAALYIGFGFVHVFSAEAFLPIMPDWVPEPKAVVIATGGCEIAGGVGLLIPRFRWLAGVMLAIYAVCVFPANVKHALQHVDIPRYPTAGGITGPVWRFSRCSCGGPFTRVAWSTGRFVRGARHGGRKRHKRWPASPKVHGV